MGKEFETQVLDINPSEIADKLRKFGAKEEKEYLQRRFVFNIKEDNTGHKEVGEWIRLREANGKTAITYKNKGGAGINQTEEVEFNVSDFDKAAEVLSKLNCFTAIYYQENKRKKFTLNEIEFTIDSWPKIPPILEIESQSEEKVNEGLKLLNFEGKDFGHAGLLKIYAKYGLDLHSFKEIKFEE